LEVLFMPAPFALVPATSDQALLDAKVAKRRQNALVNLIAVPGLTAAWNLLRGRSREHAVREATKAWAVIAAVQGVYELESALYRRTLSSEILSEPRAEVISALDIREQEHSLIANLVVGVGQKYLETRSVRVTARRGALLGAFYGSLSGGWLYARRRSEHQELGSLGSWRLSGDNLTEAERLDRAWKAERERDAQKEPSRPLPPTCEFDPQRDF
jgi:hypothetical protein